MSPELERLIEQAKARVDAMSPEERAEMYRAQRRSWVKGELMLAYPDMSEQEAEARVAAADYWVPA